jgi:hypothetical protein
LLVLIVASPPARRLAGQAAVPPEAQAEQERQEKIQRLMERAVSATDPADRVKYYSEVLKLDASNQIAYERKREAEGEVEKRRREQQSEAETQRAAREKAEAWKETKQTATDGGIEALARDETEQLRAALATIQQALQINTSDPELLGLKTRIEERISAKRIAFIAQFVLGVIVLLALILTGLYYLLRKKRMILEVLEGPRKGERLILKGEIVRIGSLETSQEGQRANDLVLSDAKKMISRYHCEIHRNGRHFFIVDLSRHGTMVNDQPLDTGSWSRLRNGDRISLAGEALLLFCAK